MEKEKKDNAKKGIILFVIGVLVGAVISTASFCVYTTTLGVNNSSNTSSSRQMQGGMPPEMPSGDNSGNAPSGTPPEKPGESNNSENTEDTQRENS
ncbi:hypothetical protein IJM16_03720 [Candidatus Saccharibacteria bacterium]|nr:hypothetical protein [Candidatus Saccharibacteria bacterium]